MSRRLVYTCFCILNLCIAIDAACCPNNWIPFEESCYLFADEITLDWTEGTHFCASHSDTRVVTIDSKVEELFLRDNSQRLFKGTLRQGTWFWIGATDDEIEGVWVWYTDHKRVSDGYNNWYPGQPEHGDSNNQDCACLYGGNNFTWHDFHCEQKGHVICEMNRTNSDFEEIIG